MKLAKLSRWATRVVNHRWFMLALLVVAIAVIIGALLFIHSTPKMIHVCDPTTKWVIQIDESQPVPPGYTRYLTGCNR